MKTDNKKSKNNWQSYWPVGVVIVLVLIGWYVATSSSWWQSEARQELEVSGTTLEFQPATVQFRRLEYAAGQDDAIGRLLRQGSYNHFVDQFQLTSRQTADSRLEVQLHLPVARDGLSYGRPSFSFQTVTDPATDCDRPFSLRFNLLMQNRLVFNLDQDDANVYYCFDVRLPVADHIEGVQLTVIRGFSIAEPIRARNLAKVVTSGSLPADVVDTDYDVRVFVGDDTDNPVVDHLDAWFKLRYANRSDEVFVLINRPGKLTLPLTQDVQSFTVEEVRYLLVTQRSQCSRSLFNNSETQKLARSSYDAPAGAMPPLPIALSLPLTPDNLRYCVRVKLKGDIRLRRDFHPTRIFYLD